MNFKNRRREVERVDEPEIVPNWHVFVPIVGQETEENMPLKPLILTPLEKIVDNCLPLGFHPQFFCVRVPDIIVKQKTKMPVGTRFRSILYSTIDGRQCENKQHGDTSPEKVRDIFFMFSTNKYKKRARCSSLLRAMCVLFKLELFSTQLYVYRIPIQSAHYNRD